MDLFVLVIQIALAAILAVAAVGKFMDLPGSRKAVNDFGVPRQYADPLGTALPFGELLLAILLLFGPTARLGALGAFLLFLAFIAGIGWNLRQGRTPDCHCFGELHSSPAGWHTIIRNSVFSLMALIVVVAGGRGPVETIDNLSSAGKVGLWVTLLIAGLGVTIAWFLDRLMKQQEQLRADLEALQTASLFAGLTPSPGTAHEASLTMPAAEPSLAAPVIEEPVGEPAPAFDLPSLGGGRLTLDDVTAGGKPTLLLFTTPTCGFCSAMYPEVQEWANRFGHDLNVAVIGRGAIEANRQKLDGFDFPFAAVDESGDTAAMFDAVATPTGVIVMPNGTILGSVARGRPEIQKLVGRTLRQRQLQRTAAPAPTAAPAEPATVPVVDAWPAPSFELATPDGGTLSLASLLARGKPVLLIFWRTTCGFCNRFAPEVGEWYRRFGNDVTIALITDASDAGIKEEAATFGFEYVGLQQDRDLMSQYGGNGTPSAVLVQPDGFVQDYPAQGAPQIRRLIGRVLSRNGNAPSPAPARIVAAVAANGAHGEDEADAETRAEEMIRQSLLASLKGPDLGTEGSRLPWQTLDGDYVGLDEYRGREVTLVFWGVDCEFSQRMLPDLKEWESEAGDAVEDILIISSSGDADANRAQGLRSRVVLDDAFSAGTDFGVTGTPAAVRLDAEGRVASSLAVGSDAVLDLLYDLIDAPDPALN